MNKENALSCDDNKYWYYGPDRVFAKSDIKDKRYYLKFIDDGVEREVESINPLLKTAQGYGVQVSKKLYDDNIKPKN